MNLFLVRPDELGNQGAADGSRLRITHAPEWTMPDHQIGNPVVEKRLLERGAIPFDQTAYMLHITDTAPDRVIECGVDQIIGGHPVEDLLGDPFQRPDQGYPHVRRKLQRGGVVEFNG